jgi:hypothetical protein
VNRTAAYAAGPELIWVLLFALTVLLVSRNQPPTYAGNQRLELVGWFLPWVGVVLSFVSLAWAPGSPWWWLARILLAGAVGVVIVTGHLCGGIDYQDSRNSGVGTAYIVFIGLGFMALMSGSVIAAFFFLTKWRFLPFLKWGLIVLAVLGAIWGIICWLASFGKPGAP